MAEEQSEHQILAELTQRAEQLWGLQRAAALRAHLQDTSRQLAEIRRNPPATEVEPGFFL
jgi:hypothetical protein